MEAPDEVDGKITSFSDDGAVPTIGRAPLTSDVQAWAESPIPGPA